MDATEPVRQPHTPTACSWCWVNLPGCWLTGWLRCGASMQSARAPQLQRSQHSTHLLQRYARQTLYSMLQVRFPRRTLAQRFAVLLMQSCYRAADALDFIPMVRGPQDRRLSGLTSQGTICLEGWLPGWGCSWLCVIGVWLAAVMPASRCSVSAPAPPLMCVRAHTAVWVAGRTSSRCGSGSCGRGGMPTTSRRTLGSRSGRRVGQQLPLSVVYAASAQPGMWWGVLVVCCWDVE